MRLMNGILLFLCAAVCLCAGCGRGETPEEVYDLPVSTNTPGPVTGNSAAASDSGSVAQLSNDLISLRLMWDGAALTGDPLAELISEKMNIAVDVVAVPEDYDAQLDLLIASDDAPDLFLAPLNPSHMHTWIENGVIRDIPQAITDTYPLMSEMMNGQAFFNAFKNINAGKIWYAPRINDREPMYGTNSARIFYRKDMISPINSTEDLLSLATDEPAAGLAVDASVSSVFAYMYGLDPACWIMENGRYIPAYYADAMLEPLAFARRLWKAGLLTFVTEPSEATLPEQALWITSAGDAASFERALFQMTDQPSSTAEELYDTQIGVMDIPYAPNRTAVWGYTFLREGWFVRAGVDDTIINRAWSLFEYSLTAEGREYARYGVPGDTYAKNASGLFLYTDPQTNRAYDLNALYPSGGYLGLITNDAARDTALSLPSVISNIIRSACREAADRYYCPALSETGALCLAVPSPTRDALQIDFNAYFYFIVTNEDPVEDAFERFRELCRKQGLETAAAEVTDAVNTLGDSIKTPAT